MLGGLDAGYDAVLFYGLTLKEMIDIADDMAMLPFEQARAFVDESMLKEVPPPRAAIRSWRSMGVVVRPFRWMPAFGRAGYEGKAQVVNPGPFYRQAQMFLELLAVAHAAPVLRLAMLP